MRSGQNKVLKSRGKNSELGRPAYESPKLIPLGELARGHGDCGPGSVLTPDCTVGGTPSSGLCNVGGVATP